MRRKIRSSIGAKTFLSISVLLIVCCTLIYGLVMCFMPNIFSSEVKNGFTADFNALVETLNKKGFDGTTQQAYDFCIANNAAIDITDNYDNSLLRVNTEKALSDSDNTQLIYTTAKTSYKNESYLITAQVSNATANQAFDVLLKLLPIIIPIIFFISLLGAALQSKYFSAPLVSLCGIAKKMSKLDMTWKCDTKRTDEVGILAVSLNEMSAKLKDTLEKLQTANLQLQLDIEQERRQEQQRKEFFTAVSHELKTPITIAKGELEGMIYQVGDYTDRDTYLRHTLKTVQTMEHLVQEILSAAKMSSDDFQLDISDINISHLIEKCCREVKGLAEDKSIAMSLDIEQGFHYRGDERLLKKAFSNIIGNAVFHSPKQATITVMVKKSLFAVDNSNSHLLDEDLAQLFIPFYRVDKSHNSNSGGSGLGLYIVKTILDRHNLKYKLENAPNGVSFSIDFH